MKHLNISASEFLANYWQKKPVVIRNAFQTNEDLLDEHELAGLAMEEDIDSRIIAHHNNQWQMETGPFTEFDDHCVGQWTLLVQGVENLLQEAQDLLDEFSFIPAWRRDDLMISFSVEGAGVGPHLDQYDVFIIQGKGKRRWQVGPKGDYPELHPHPKLRQIPPFEAIIDEVLQPGDMVYIPPGYPHNGIALEGCLNYSVGFRAATQSELLNSFCDHLIDNDLQGKRYEDPSLTTRQHSSELKRSEIERFRQQMLDALNHADFEDWLGTHLSDAPPFIPELPDQDISTEQLIECIQQNYSFQKSPGLRYLNYETSEGANTIRVFINGEQYEYPVSDQEEVCLLLNSTVWQPKKKNNFKISSQFIHNLSTLINKGAWIIKSD